MSWQRARSPEQKAERIENILDAAGELFDERSIDDISMTEVADCCGMAKASLYGYFGSKEEVFLFLFRREGHTWLAAIESALKRLKKPNPETVAHAIARTTIRHERLCYLATLLHVTLEENTPTQALLEFKLDMRVPLRRFADAVQSVLPDMSADDARTLFIQHHALLVGLWPFANPGHNAASALKDERLNEFHIEFSSVFERSLCALISSSCNC